MSNERSGVFKFRFDSAHQTLESSSDKRRVIKRLLRSLTGYKWKIMLFVLVTVIYSVTFAVFPKMLGKIIDLFAVSVVQYLLGFGDGKVFVEMIPYAASAIIFFVANALCSFWQGIIVSNFVTSYSLELRNELVKKYNKLSVKFIDSSDHEQIYGRLTDDVDALNQSINLLFIRVITAIIVFTVVIITQLLTNFKLGVVSFIFCTLGIVLIFLAERKEVKDSKVQQSQMGKMFLDASEFYRGISVLQNSGKLRERIQALKDENKISSDSTEKSRNTGIFKTCVSEITLSLCLVAATVISAAAITAEKFSVGGLECQFIYIRKLFSAFAGFSYVPGVIRTTLSSAGRIFDFFDIDDGFTEGTEHMRKPTGENIIEFRNVSFRYNEDSKQILENVSFSIPATGITALTGITGVGKTTVIKLLLGFYEPDEGEILFNGQKVSSLLKDEYLSEFNVVLQGATLFDDTIANNIAYSCEDVDFDRVLAAAEICGADEFISKLENGYNTVFNSGSPNLSDGEIQLVLLARAFLKSSDYFVFDEATSSLDLITEKKISSALDEISKKSSVIIISHRNSVIGNATHHISISDAKVSQKNSIR